MSVGELADRQPVSRPAVSQHLRVLEEASLVSAQSQGNRRVYRIAPAGWKELRQYLDGFWTDVLFAYGERVSRLAEVDGGESHAPRRPSNERHDADNG